MYTHLAFDLVPHSQMGSPEPKTGMKSCRVIVITEASLSAPTNPHKRVIGDLIAILGSSGQVSGVVTMTARPSRGSSSHDDDAR
jgi:hypothetical protein